MVRPITQSHGSPHYLLRTYRNECWHLGLEVDTNPVQDSSSGGPRADDAGAADGDTRQRLTYLAEQLSRMHDMVRRIKAVLDIYESNLARLAEAIHQPPPALPLCHLRERHVKYINVLEDMNSAEDEYFKAIDALDDAIKMFNVIT